MKLDEIEQLARDCIAEPVRGTDAAKLARAVLAILPVVRAAERWTTHGPGQQHADDLFSSERDIVEAVEQMREVLK